VRVVERGGGESGVRPAGERELATGARHVEVGDAHHMHSTCQARLREKHGAELAGADDADGYRAAGGFAFEQLDGKVHRAALP
jgi:hypothetical protein